MMKSGPRCSSYDGIVLREPEHEMPLRAVNGHICDVDIDSLRLKFEAAPFLETIISATQYAWVPADLRLLLVGIVVVRVRADVTSLIFWLWQCGANEMLTTTLLLNARDKSSQERIRLRTSCTPI